MLAQTKGAIRFWYTVDPTGTAADPAELAADNGLTVQIIPMTIQCLERANMRVVYFIPPAHVGDGQWRQGAFAYDFSAAPDVQWVHVSARILSPGYALFLDDFEWVEQVGPVLQPARFALEEAPGEEGERAVVTLTLGNIGDAASAPTEAALLLPPTLAAEALVAAVPPIEPGDTLEIAGVDRDRGPDPRRRGRHRGGRPNPRDPARAAGRSRTPPTLRHALRAR